MSGLFIINRGPMTFVMDNWSKEAPVAITVCDAAGIILEMNDRALASFSEEGGAALIGTNLLDCHPEPARSKVRELLLGGQTNAYTIEKKGLKKLIYQMPWYCDGVLAGLVEFSLPLPQELPHLIRSGS